MLSLRTFVGTITLSEKFVYLKKKHEVVLAEEVDLYNLDLYKDYVPVPHIEKKDIIQAFFDHYHLNKEKQMFCESEDLVADFNNYIHDYSHCMLGFTMYELYWDFQDAYLKPIAVKWLVQNKIPYEDDLGKGIRLF